MVAARSTADDASGRQRAATIGSGLPHGFSTFYPVPDSRARNHRSGGIRQRRENIFARQSRVILQNNFRIARQRENQTLATITFQNYFRMYKKLAGMTGTADTEAAEFDKIYKLEVTMIPTNRVLLRKEFQDVVYRTEEEKFRNAAKEIKELYERHQPVLVGTVSVEKSERLS